MALSVHVITNYGTINFCVVFYVILGLFNDTFNSLDYIVAYRPVAKR
jgi:hypothetical protein